MGKIQKLVSQVVELLPAMLYVLGLASLVLAAWCFSLITGLIMLGVALLFTGWVLTDNTANGDKR